MRSHFIPLLFLGKGKRTLDAKPAGPRILDAGPGTAPRIVTRVLAVQLAGALAASGRDTSWQ
jgi:hypothetical protein